MKAKKISTKIVLPIALIITIGFMIFCPVIILNFSTLATEQIDNYAEQMSYNFSYRLKSQIDSAVFTTRTIASLAKGRIESGDTDRVEFENELMKIAEDRPELLAVYSIFELGAFGNDADYINSEYGSPAGRYSPYIVNSGGATVPFHVVNTLIEDVVKDYHYMTTKTSESQYISAPYIYQIDNVDYYAVSLCTPIMINGKYYGAAAVNILVDDFFKMFENTDIFNTGYVSLVTDRNVVAYSPVAEDISKNADDVFKGNLASTLKNLTSGSKSQIVEDKSLINNKPVKSYVTPVVFDSAPDASWKIAINIPVNEARASLYRVIILCIVLAVIIVGIIVFSTIGITAKITKPVNVMNKYLSITGNKGKIHYTDSEKEEIRHNISNDEIGQSMQSFLVMMERLENVSKEIEKISNGDLTANVKEISEDDNMVISIKNMIHNLNSMFNEINTANFKVSEGAEQISDNINQLSVSAETQVDSINNLSKSIDEIALKTNENTQMAEKASKLSSNIRNNANKGSEQMNQMMQAVNEITEASNNISNVIKVIDDIAFQTNILALNAAVEAARAGEFGKGFAVVADEVRNLAAKSAEAAKGTGTLIANSIEKAQLGAKIADETAASLVEIVKGINESNEIITEISVSSNAQSADINEINNGMRQVVEIVQQTTSATQQSAVATEQMGSQSENLSQLLAHFKLK